MARTERAKFAEAARKRARRSLAALDRDVVAGNISEEAAGRQRAAFQRVIAENTYNRKTRSYGTSQETAQKRASEVFGTYSAKISQELRKAPSELREAFIERFEAVSFRQDFRAALRGDISSIKESDAQLFIRSNMDILQGWGKENYLQRLADVFGNGNLQEAFDRWKKEVADGDDFHALSRETVYARTREINDERRRAPIADALKVLEEAWGEW